MEEGHQFPAKNLLRVKVVIEIFFSATLKIVYKNT